jgi:deazaflavin-dependent oxidoreductase (nitroreductase family)
MEVAEGKGVAKGSGAWLVRSDRSEEADTNGMGRERRKGSVRWLLRAPVGLYRWRLGWLLGKRFLLLTHIGRRTGARHQTVLEVMEYREEGPEAVVMSGFGRGSDWLRNIEASGGEEVDVGRRHFVACHRFLEEEEAVRVLAGYERRNRLMAPVVRAVLSRLVGWTYHGGEEERRKVVRELPLVGFREKRSGE